MNARATVASDHRETSDTYRGEVIRAGRYRVAVCRDGIQWILQRQRPGKTGVGGAWDALNFTRQRLTLQRLWRERTGEDAPAGLAFLPERFQRT